MSQKKNFTFTVNPSSSPIQFRDSGSVTGASVACDQAVDGNLTSKKRIFTSNFINS